MMTDIRPSVCLQRGDSRSGHSSVRGDLWHNLLAGEASLKGEHRSYFAQRQRFLFTPSSVLFPPTFCVTQREEFSLLEEFSLGVFLLTESLTYFFLCQIVELSIRLIVMWSVPFNLNLYDTYLGLAMIYNQVRNLVAGVIGFIPCIQGPFSSSSYWFKKMYYSDIGPHVRGQGGKILMYEERFIFFLSTSDIISSELLEMAFYSLSNVVIENKSFSTEFSYNNIWLH